MRILRNILLLFLIFSLTYAKPAESEADTKEVAPKAEKKKDGVDRAVLAEDQSWEAWANANSMTIISSTLGTLFLVAGLAMVGYYFVYLNYFAYNTGIDPSYPYYTTPGSQYPQTGYAAYAVGSRSIDSTPSTWNLSWPQVLYMLSLAQETYEKFDFQSLDCQKKALCELAHKQTDFGETGRKISNTFSLLDVVEGLPMPTIIQTYLKEYKEALNQGKNSDKDCAMIYSNCSFSLKEIISKYQKRAASGKF